MSLHKREISVFLKSVAISGLVNYQNRNLADCVYFCLNTFVLLMTSNKESL